MTTQKRAGVFDDAEALDVSGFAPKPPERVPAKPEQVRAVSEAAQFSSREPHREPAAAAAKREPRRYRTGRNMQLNIKARSSAIDAFYAIADEQHWVLGETFERAVEALKREFPTKK